MTDRTTAELHDVVRVPSAQTQPIDTRRKAQGCAIGPWRNRRADGDRRLDDPAGPLQRLDHHRRFELQLSRRVDVLPRTATASCGVCRAWRNNAVRRRLDHIDDLGANKILLRLYDLDLHQLVRQGATHEGHATVGHSGDRIAARGHLLGAHLDCHRRRL